MTAFMAPATATPARRRACEPFSFLGLRLDPDLNACSPADADVAAANSAVRVLIVKGQENWQIAAESLEAWRTA